MEGLIGGRVGVLHSRQLRPSSAVIRDWILDAQQKIQSAFVYQLLDFRHAPEYSSRLHPQRLAARELPAQLTSVARSDLAHLPEICPHLLTLSRPDTNGLLDEELMQLLIRQCLEQPFNAEGDYDCGWIVSQLAPSALALRLQKSVVAYDPLKGAMGVIPMFEPHRHTLFLNNADSTMQTYWIDGTLHWLFRDASGNLRSVECHAGLDPLRHLRLHAPFWKQQRRIPIARLGLLALSKTGRPIPENAEVRADRWLSIAEEFGLRQVEDQILFVVNGLTLAPAWYRHSACCRAIEEAVAGGETFAEQLRSFDDRVLEEIARYAVEE